VPGPRRIVVGMTGSTGSVYGIRLLQILRQTEGVETHLIVSAPGKRTIVEETDFTIQQVQALAHVVHDNNDIGASIASGSFRTHGMVIVPCSIKTASAIAHCYGNNLISRAADVTIKEGRTLVAVVRETPLHLGHLKVLTALAEMNAVVLPPMPAFYLRPRTLDEIVDHTVARIVERLGLPQDLVPEWEGTGRVNETEKD
jgi:4-hydroxy-3-polyprenylbenzoate decarboxylase